MEAAGGQAAKARRYFFSIGEIASGDLLDAVRFRHRWDVIRAYLVGRGIAPHKTYDQRDPVAFYQWTVEAGEVAAFEAGLDKVDRSWRDLLGVS